MKTKKWAIKYNINQDRGDLEKDPALETGAKLVLWFGVNIGKNMASQVPYSIFLRPPPVECKMIFFGEGAQLDNPLIMI